MNSSTSGTTRRSESPPSKRQPPPAKPRPEEPAVAFKRACHEVAQCLGLDLPFNPPVRAVDEDWDRDLLDYGYIIAKEWVAQGPLRIIANTNPSARSIDSVLTEAINQGIPFKIAVKIKDFPLFRNGSPTDLERATAKAMYSPDFQEVSFVKEPDVTFARTYLGRLGDLLSRPHARAFIGLGGPYSWVARRYGGQELIQKFMSGPSTQTVDFFRGENDAHYKYPIDLHWDTVSDAEQALLLGHIPPSKTNPAERWLYPPPNILKDHCWIWWEPWNPHVDKMFAYIASTIDRRVHVVRTRAEWVHFFHSWNNNAPEFIPSADNYTEMQILCETFGVPSNWDRMSLRHIVVPEWRRL
ncbi:hypothetical protein CPC08DRAFT_650925 [Agrocybe pediades]|nr:hypothetical protein CPC08DRAFT_650925 [Agrocybe pediades]